MRHPQTYLALILLLAVLLLACGVTARVENIIPDATGESATVVLRGPSGELSTVKDFDIDGKISQGSLVCIEPLTITAGACPE